MPTKKSATVDRMDTPGKTYKSRILPLLVGVTLLLVMAGNAAGQAKDATSPGVFRSRASAQAQVRAASASWPLRFEENVGQVHGADARQVRFVSRGNAYTLFLTSTEAVLVLRHGAGHGKDAGKAAPVVARMRLSGANPASHLAGRDELLGKSNYFRGNDPSQWHAGIPNYGRVTAAEVYPGINLVYHGNQGQLEYDFEVAPHADPHKIRFVLEGIQGLRTDSRGDLLVKVAGGELRFRQPVAYQKEGGVERPVPVRYVLKGKNQVAFRLARYDTRQPLLIDPVLAYSTYLGGSDIDIAYGIAVAPDGSAFIAGGTFSTDFPTAHPLQPNAGGPYDFPKDAFVAKISPDGSTLLYSTYLGGEVTDIAYGIAVDSFGNAYVTGTTDSPHFPVTADAFNTLCGGDGKCGASWNPQGYTVYNCFVTKLNVAGSALIYSGLLGYYEDVACRAIAVDGPGNAYVTGETGPNIAPTIPIIPPATPPPPFPILGGFQATLGGTGTDVFIDKIDATGSEILYSSYLGGSDEDVGYGIAVDSSADAYVTGVTYSQDFPTTGRARQSAYAGAGDAFLTKVNTNAAGAASLVYSSYLGGSGLDQGNGIAVDSAGNAYVTGATTSKASSLRFTVPAGAFQPDCALDSQLVCEGDAFVAKLNPTLSGSASLLYFTYLGGSLADSGTGIALDASNNVYVTGSTVSSDFPVTAGVFQPHFGGGNADAFVAELNLSNPPSTALVYSTFLGGTDTDNGTGIAVDVNGGAYVTGETCSLDFPLSNPLQATPGGNCDAFVSKVIPSGGVALSPAGLVFTIRSLNSTSPPQTVTLTNGGNTALTITSIALTGADAADFSQTNTCDGSVAALGQCAITVTFTPKAVGTRIAHITITDDSPAPNSTQVVDLTGTGGNLPTVSLSPTSLAFGNQAVNTTSSPLFLTVTNTGTAALNMTSVIASGGFAVQTNGCAVPLQATTPASNCDIGVTFTPTLSGASVDSLTLTDNAPDSPQIILLTGTGVLPPIASLSPASVTFATSQAVGTTSAPQTVTLTNPGSATLFIVGITASANFGETNNCGASILAGGNCSIYVTFMPTAVGNLYGTLTVTDNNNGAPASTQVIPLAGTGLGVPAVSLSASTLSFGSQIVTSTSAAQTVTVTNSGTATLTLGSITAAAPFAQTNTCGSPVAAGGICTISVTFTPTTAGSAVGSVSLVDNAANSPQTISLTGTGVTAPIANLSPASVTFATPQAVGTTSAPQTVTLTNTGSATLLIVGITASANFGATNNCGASIPVGGNCSISVTFTPTAVGDLYGTLTVTDNNNGAPASTQTVPLAGTGLAAPAVTLSASSLTFGAQAAGTTSAAQTLTLTNSGTAVLTINSIVITGDFSQTNTCPHSLAAGAACTISVSFSPTVAGTRTGTLTITDNGPTSPQVVSLGGSGSDFGLAVAPLTATVVAGNSTNLTVTVNPLFGYNAQVTLSCSGLPTAAACTASPPTLTPNGISSLTSTLTISTTRRTSVPPGGQPRPRGPGLPLRPEVWLMSALALFGLWSLVARKNRLRWATVALALTMLLLMGLAACGGGGTGYVDPTGTPVGTYRVTVNGSSGAVTHSATVTLTVQ